ncbi:hypothetical protein GCM10023213_14000 [Prosthecobacter algae]|uniref:Virion structural protein n=1 Tax=Prosthecobacter algae TaxID=1144682 RepID=A0ABP9NZF7_9BACT
MGITSSTILRKAGRITYDGGVFYSGDAAINVRLNETRFAIKADMFAKIQERPQDRIYEIKCPLVGEWEHLALLWPHGSTAIGASIFSNETLKINTRDGEVYTFSNVAVTTSPTIRAIVGQTLIGEVTFTAILKDGADPGDSDAYVTIGSESYGSDAFSVAAIKTPIWANAWGASPFDAFKTSGGITLDFPLTFEPVKVDGLGTVNMTLVEKAATAKGTPVGVTMAQVLTAINANTAMGSAPTQNDLIITGTGVHLQLYNAMLRDPQFNWHSKTDLIGELTWMACQDFTTNVADPLYYIGTEAPA